MSAQSITAAIAWSSWGPYHLARLRACRETIEDGLNFVGVGFAHGSDTYAWQAESGSPDTLRVLQREVTAEALPVTRLVPLLARWWGEVRPDVVFVPSYAPASSTVLLAFCAVTGTPAVMMNDTHAGTTDAAGWKMFIKGALVRLFSAGLLAGRPQVRFFAGLGLAPSRLRMGYDVVDNEFFAHAAERVRASAEVVRQRWALPSRFLLSLGRFVAKKNLGTLVRAYAMLPSRAEVALVFVGSGEEGAGLRRLAAELDLEVVEDPIRGSIGGRGAVWFYPFQQVAVLPEFYALAEVFVLASHLEEWGLVVNEAMACATPVVVSRAAGCAEDLVAEGVTGRTFDPQEPAALADVLGEMLVDPAATAELGRRGQEHVRRHFGCDRFRDSARELARTLLREKNGGGDVV